MGTLGEASMVSGPLNLNILKGISATKKHVHWQEEKPTLGRYRLKLISWAASRSSQGTDKKVAINCGILGIFYSLCPGQNILLTGTPHAAHCHG